LKSFFSKVCRLPMEHGKLRPVMASHWFGCDRLQVAPDTGPS
jgi:hypothetical protein